jgi:formylglycine-generating enzyme required for sulfatase activity
VLKQALGHKNPQAPVVNITLQEMQKFAAIASNETGRKLVIMKDGKSEYSIRGRELDRDGNPTGPITSTTFFFGDDENEVIKHGWFVGNSDGHAHGVREVPEGANPKDFENSFGVKDAIGNVWKESLGGFIRGGSFGSDGHWDAGSSSRDEGYSLDRRARVGFRLAEDI